MTSQITRAQNLTDRVATVKISLSAKDVGDDAAIKTFGDIKINPTGYFNDPDDDTYPQFYVDAGPAIPFFHIGEIKATFANDALNINDLQKRANLWGNKIQLDIQNAITTIRTLHDTTTQTTVITI